MLYTKKPLLFPLHRQPSPLLTVTGQFRPLPLGWLGSPPLLEPLLTADLSGHLTQYPEISAVGKVISLFLAWPGF